MEKSNFALRLIERLPFGVIAAMPDDSLYTNKAARESLASAPATCAALRDCAPALAELLRYADTSSAGRRLELSGRFHHVQPWRVSATETVLVLMPESLLEHTYPDLPWLQQSYHDFQEIFRNSFDGIFVADGTGKTLMINAGCERNYDLPATDMVGKDVAVFERKGLITPVIAHRVIAERRRVTAVQHTHTGKTIMVTGIPLFDDDGRVRRVIINSRNTTELLQLQEELARTQDNLRRMESEVHELRRVNLEFEGMVLDSPRMQDVAALAIRVAKVDTNILIAGETGVGKEVVAKLIHRESTRAQGPFIKINCGAIPRDLLESELFGYEAGAFTGATRQGKVGLIETASEGTLFLDEIGDLPLELQVKLLQVLQDRAFSRVGGTRTVTVDLRIITATNVDLEAMVAQKRFRNDLYYRLNVVPINIPPLRQRREDIFPLIQRYLKEFNSRYGLDKWLSEAALQRLMDYNWPGNVRELRNIIERLVVTASGESIATDDLPRQIRAGPGGFDPNGLDYNARVARFQAGLVQQAVARYGTTRAAAERLNISQSTVVRKLNAAAARADS